MKSKLILVCTLAALSLCLFSCSPSPVSIDASSSGQQVEIANGGTLTVTLQSNSSTGFAWPETVELSDSSVLNQTKHELVPPADTSAVGAPGEEVWTFKALKKGTCAINMEYSQPWAGGTKSAETFNLTVVVK
ncbi:MAG: protease inhibitor I42 family protein [Dehalococcoidia bacterium]|nr:protease inhibitor I42 family protein [Dehalococcoidia bacterium]